MLMCVLLESTSSRNFLRVREFDARKYLPWAKIRILLILRLTCLVSLTRLWYALTKMYRPQRIRDGSSGYRSLKREMSRMSPSTQSIVRYSHNPTSVMCSFLYKLTSPLTPTTDCRLCDLASVRERRKRWKTAFTCALRWVQKSCASRRSG